MSRRKLLLADDSITIQKVVNLTFADEGIDVVTVGDGEAAIAQLASDIPDILLADVNMPGPTGYEICEGLRAKEATRNLPVILLVGSFEPFDEAEASRVGANAYLTKPFQSIKQLITQVNELIDAARPVDPEAPTEVPNVGEPRHLVEVPALGDPEPVASTPQAEASPSEARVFDDLGYEVAVPSTAAHPAAASPDDIDNLYERSLSGGSNDDLSDIGIDDEMIETSYAAVEPANDLASFAEESMPNEDAESQAAETVLEEQPIDSATHQSTETEHGFRSGYDQRFREDPSKFENTISFENWQPADMRDHGGDPADAMLDPVSSSETDVQNVEAAAPPPTVGEDTIRMENRFETTGAAFRFDDADLLDLSEGGKEPVEITSPASAVEQGSSRQLVTLSPELIEMIAQRVVEKLSEKY